MATKDLEHDINLIDEAAAGLRIDSSFESSPIVGKILPNSIISYREIVYERKSQLMQYMSCRKLSYFKTLPQPPQPSAATP